MIETEPSRTRLTLAWVLAGAALVLLAASLLEIDGPLVGGLSWLWLGILAIALGWVYLVVQPRGDG